MSTRRETGRVPCAALHEDAAGSRHGSRSRNPSLSVRHVRQHDELNRIAVPHAQRVAQADTAQDLQLLRGVVRLIGTEA